MSDELYYARPGPIVPLANIGQNVLIRRLNAYHLYRIRFREGVPPSAPLMNDFGAIAAGATLLGITLQPVLEMPEYQLGHFRMRVIEDIEIALLEPRAVARFDLRNVIAEVSAFTTIYDPCSHTTEFCVYEDTWPFANVTNPSDYALVVSRVVFWGFKYVLDFIQSSDNIEAINQPYSAIVSEGW